MGSSSRWSRPRCSAPTPCLLNTSFAGPQLADVVEREGVDLLIYDDEFAGVVAAADELAAAAGADPGLDRRRRRVRRTPRRRPGRAATSVSDLPARSARAGSCCSPPAPPAPRRAPAAPAAATSARWSRCWTGSRGGPSATVVIAAPMFHAWGFGQLLIAASMTCTVVTRRRFDPEATLKMVADYRRDRAGRRTGDDRADPRPPARDPAALRHVEPEVRHRERLADASRCGGVVHGRVRRRRLQQLQRHRGRDDRHRHPGRPALRPRHRRPAVRRHRREDPGRGRSRGGARRGRHDLRAQQQPVRRLHQRRHEVVPRGLHVLGRRRPARRRPVGSTSSGATTR